ncbi:hypothetical protein [uncultured Dokdonia sp.]|uniref:hypothetical protein n=1 Tax=uncultured Dokdonia sp. TaxID=575653 RepID=UPI0026146C7B|nr:hypothetical protein [uncultured Dokdonia sp.]
MKTIIYPINRFALKLTVFSLCFGILQVIIYAIYPNDTSIYIGLLHLYPTIAIHTIVLLIVLVNGIKNYKDIGEHFLVILTMLANIPVALGCFYAVITLSDL